MASSAPIIFKRNKPKPALRNRETSPEDTTERNDTETADNSPSTLAVKLKNKIKRTKPKSRLSFGGADEDEGDGEVFKVKKSSLSRKMTLGAHPASVPLTLDQATITANQGPTYDAAYLSELKASTPSTRHRMKFQDDPYDADMSVDFGDTSMQSIDMDVAEDSAAFIPSESSIKVAKEKRDRLRKTYVTDEEDFVSLSVAKREDFSQGPHPESRLVREEDELGEGDDEFAEYTSAQERIALGKKSRKVEAAQRRDAMKELIADAEEEDEETVEWEQEQLRRGGHRAAETPATKVKQTYKPAPIPPAMPVPTLDPAISRLSQQLAQLTASHARNSAALNSLAQERNEVDDREKEMRGLVENAETKRAWFDSFKEWVESVAGFLDEKYPQLEKLEELHRSLLKERRDMVAQRRREDTKDDLATFLGALPATVSKDAEVEELDELGRTIPKPNPSVERRERRAARTARRQIRQSRRRKLSEEEGYSTDSSLPPQDMSAYSEALQDLVSRKKEVLADVKAEEFRDPAKGKWAVWREKYSDTYVGAWGGLGVVSVWEFWVRFESVAWDCIEDQRSLHDFKWYKGLYEYCRPGEGTIVEERELGVDGDLVASMVSTAVIPMLCSLIEAGALDVYSEQHVKRMVDLAEEIEASIEPESPKFQLLIRSVMGVFQNVVTESETSLAAFRGANQPLPAFNPDAIPARRRFLARHIKLLRNMLIWKKYTGERFGLGMLIGRLVEGCILWAAEGGWDVGGEEMARNVANMLPVEHVPHQLKQLRGAR